MAGVMLKATRHIHCHQNTHRSGLLKPNTLKLRTFGAKWEHIFPATLLETSSISKYPHTQVRSMLAPYQQRTKNHEQTQANCTVRKPGPQALPCIGPSRTQGEGLAILYSWFYILFNEAHKLYNLQASPNLDPPFHGLNCIPTKFISWSPDPQWD